MSLTTRQVAELMGKSPANVRARASKGDFGPTAPGPDGLPRYDRERVRVIFERMAARQAQTRNSVSPALPLALPDVLTTLQAQHREQVALCHAWLEASRQEAQELRALLRDREETTRETLSHLDMLQDQNLRQMQAHWERERAQWAAALAAKDAEIARLHSERKVTG